MVRHARMISGLLCIIVLAVVAGCVSTAPPTPIGSEAPRDERFTARLLDIAAEYDEYGRVGMEARLAPAYCAAPRWNAPSRPFYSQSGDEATHGQKLYWLFVKDKPDDIAFGADYAQHDKPQAVGQVIVKESWTSEEVKTPPVIFDPIVREVRVRRKTADGREELVGAADRFVPYGWKGDRTYHAKEKAALFVMFKVEPDTPGTDAGWVYGTTTADGQQVTSIGMIASCMGCHQKAPHDRLFGLPGAKK